MKTYASLLLLLAASVSCAPSQASIDATEVSTKVEKVPVKDGYNIIPLFEIKEIPPHTSNPMCSPKCYMDVYKKPVYLVMRSDDSKDFEAIFLEEGLKAYRPRDRVKLFNVDGKAVGMIFSKFDFPLQKYPHVYDKFLKDPESRHVKAPFVVITNEADFKDVNRRENYERVAEMEVSSEGFIREIKLIKKRAVIDDKLFDLLDGRNEDLMDIEGKLASDPNMRSNFQDLMKLMMANPSFSKFGSPYRPFYPHPPVYDNNKNYFSYPFEYDSFFYPHKNPYVFPGYKPQYFNAPYSYEYAYNRFPEYGPWNYEPFKENPGYFQKPWYPQEYYPGGVSKYPYFPQHSYPPVPYSPSYKPFEDYGFNPNRFKNTYDPYYNKYFPSFLYNKFPYGQYSPSKFKFNEMQYDPMKYFPGGYQARLNYDSGKTYWQNSSRDPVWNPENFYPHYPHYYPGPYSPEFSFEKYPSQYYYQSGNTNFPPKYAFSNRSPALTYVLNICHGHKPSQSPSVPVDPQNPPSPYHPEPEPTPVVHSPSLKMMSPVMTIGNIPSTGEFYTPDNMSRNNFFRPGWIESEEIRKLVRPQIVEEEIKRPFQFAPPTYYPKFNRWSLSQLE